MIELLIFDCDGVLVDSERIAMRVDAAAITELGWPTSEEDVIERFMGRSVSSMAGEIEAHLGRRLPDGWEADLQDSLREAFETGLNPVDGVREALDRIAIPTCVASSGSHEKMRHTLGLTGLYERFESRIFSADEVSRGKPAPDLFLHAARSLGVEPSACAVVEDSFYGVEAARAAGMQVFGYAGGLTPARRLEGPRTVVFGDMRDLPRLVSGAGEPSTG